MGFCLLFFVGCVLSAQAGDWAQWRGPNQDGSTDEKNLPATLDLAKNLVWSIDLPGESSATPIISKGRIFLSSTKKESKDLLGLCLDEVTGKLLWEKKLAEAGYRPPRNTMASSSPAVDGQTVVFLYTDGTCTAMDYNGTVLWTNPLSEKFGPFSLKFGYSSSPLIDEGKIYIPLLRRETPWPPYKSDEPLESYLIALDIKTGKPVFAAERPARATDETMDSYVTPVLTELNGQKQILLAGANCLTGHNPKTGQTIWEYEYKNTKGRYGRAVSMPVCDGLVVYYTIPHGDFTVAIRPDKNGRLAADSKVWMFDQLGGDCANPLLYKGLLYLLDDSVSKTFYCLNPKTGEVIWQDKLDAKGPIFASPTASDDKIYIIDESGKVTVVAAGGDKMKVLSTLELGGKPAYSTIAAANGMLYIRTAEKLYCFGLTKKL
jgi:outer membrane protein assembly factor BamB